MILQVMGSFAQFERSLIKERQREGQQAARAKGKLSGRKKSLSPEQIPQIIMALLSIFLHKKEIRNNQRPLFITDIRRI